jgi:hypothetical protein
MTTVRPSTAAHGTTSRYDAGCRCADCRAATAAYARLYRARTGAVYDKAHARATRAAARRYREEYPEGWAVLLAQSRAVEETRR